MSRLPAKMNYFRYAPHVIEGMISLKVGNLTYRTTSEDLREIFSKYGKVGDVYVPKNRYNGESRGFAFVRFYDRRDAEDALDAMDGRILDGRELRVQMARYGRPNSPRFGRDGGGGRSGYRRRSYGRRSYDRYERRRSYSRSYSRSRSRSRRRSKSRSGSRSSRSYSKGKSVSRSKSPVNNHNHSKSPSD